MKKVLIANRGENIHAVNVSANCRVCEAGYGELAALALAS